MENPNQPPDPFTFVRPRIFREPEFKIAIYLAQYDPLTPEVFQSHEFIQFIQNNIHLLGSTTPTNNSVNNIENNIEQAENTEKIEGQESTPRLTELLSSFIFALKILVQINNTVENFLFINKFIKVLDFYIGRLLVPGKMISDQEADNKFIEILSKELTREKIDCYWDILLRVEQIFSQNTLPILVIDFPYPQKTSIFIDSGSNNINPPYLIEQIDLIFRAEIYFRSYIALFDRNSYFTSRCLTVREISQVALYYQIFHISEE